MEWYSPQYVSQTPTLAALKAHILPLPLKEGEIYENKEILKD